MNTKTFPSFSIFIEIPLSIRIVHVCARGILYEQTLSINTCTLRTAHVEPLSSTTSLTKRDERNGGSSYKKHDLCR